jgi:hypothetical protein
MGVSNGNDGMPSIKVEILLALFIPYFTTFALNDVNIKERIHIE